jgi:phage shock protein C
MSGKKLARKQGKIFGVCAGLGEYFELDPTIVRIGFVLFSLLGGSSVLLYLILTLVMQKAY